MASDGSGTSVAKRAAVVDLTLPPSLESEQPAYAFVGQLEWEEAKIG